MTLSPVRFGLLVLQDAPFDVLVQRWRQAEELGFDQLWVADHSHDYRRMGGHWFDSWTVLAAMAEATQRARIGTLVSNPILRPPALLARQALTVDHLSGGRLELGIGTGIASFDHATIGSPYWAPAERATRFAEYVEVVDGLLGSWQAGPFRFDGRYHRTDSPPMTPAPVQQPRPPITVGGQSPTVLRVAVERADCWNTHGPFGRTADEILEITRQQNRQLDELCAAHGRDPATLRRSLLLFDALDPAREPLDKTIERFAEAGVGEFVLFRPDDPRELQRLAGLCSSA